MKNFAKMTIFLFVVLSLNMVAQQQSQQIIKPTLTAGELVFAVNLLNTVELKGGEVEAFIQVKDALKPYLEKISKEKLQTGSNIELSLQIGTAQNILTFMERAKIAGADAERYKKIVDSFVAAAKSASGQK